MAITCICMIVVAVGPKKGFSCPAGRLRSEIQPTG